MNSFPQAFRGLRWKLTWPFMVASPLIMLFFHLLFFIGIMIIGLFSTPQMIATWQVYFILLIFAYDFFAGFFVSIITNAFITRSLTSRFDSLVEVAKSWSKGDLSCFASDTSHDEIGQLTRTLNQMAEQLRNLLQTRQRVAVLEERQRLARDLHDSVKQHIFVVSLQIGTVRKLLHQRSDNEAEQLLLQAERTLQQVQQDLRTLIRELRPVALDKGLASALQELARTFQQQTGINMDIQIAEIQGLPPLVEEALLRVAQETLANVARHSQARSVLFSLRKEENLVELFIEDNGRGFVEIQGDEKGFGLRSIRERIKGVGGIVQIESVPAEGTRITARIIQAREEPSAHASFLDSPGEKSE